MFGKIHSPGPAIRIRTLRNRVNLVRDGVPGGFITAVPQTCASETGTRAFTIDGFSPVFLSVRRLSDSLGRPLLESWDCVFWLTVHEG